MKKDWFQIVIVYILWSGFIVLGLLSLIISRSNLTILLRLYYAGGNLQRANELRSIDQGYIIIAGILFLVLLIVVEEYLKNGVRKNKLAQRAARVFGFEILFFLLTWGVSNYLLGFSSLVILELVLLFLVSAGLLWFGYRIRPGTIQK